MARTTNGAREPSLGGQRLEKVADRERETAERMGVSHSLVAHWKSGRRKPTGAQRTRLQEFYGIPSDAWDASPITNQAEVERRQSTGAELASEYAGAPDDATSGVERLRQHLRDGIVDLDSDTELSGVRRAEALKKLVDAQVALDRSTGENALTLARIVAHPEVRRVTGLIVDALTPYPDVQAKVLAILDEARGRR